MASATPAASGRGQSTSVPEERGVRGLRCHAEWQQIEFNVPIVIVYAIFYRIVIKVLVTYNFNVQKVRD